MIKRYVKEIFIMSINHNEIAQTDIIEHFVMGKSTNNEECEDMIVIGEHFYAVIDGVTSKFSTKYEGKTAGRYCAELLTQAISSLDKDADAKSALDTLNDTVKKAYGDREITEENKMQACVIIYSKARREIFNYGDCQLMINGECFDHTKRIDALLEDLRAFAITAYLNKGGNESNIQENDIGRAAILPFLKAQSAFANKDGYFGYPVIDGTGINERLIKTYNIESGDLVVLASDGYPKLFPTLSQSEEYLRYVLKIDPLSICENKQTKMKLSENRSFDDRSYFSFIAQ